MAGTDNTVADDDALYVLTAVLLTPAQFPSVLGDDYPAACAALGLEPYADGYGLVLGQDGDGARWTVAVDDVSLVAVAIASWDCGMEYDLSPDDRSVVCALPGWPLAVAVAAPGVAAPHDPAPDPEADGEDISPLTPPDTNEWGPAQRRLGADAIAMQWAAWREQIDDETAFVPAGSGGSADGSAADAGSDEAAGSGAGADTGSGTEAGARTDAAGATGGAPDTGAASGADDAAGTETDPGADDATSGARSPEDGATSGTHPGVRRALAEARAYVDAPPPPGRVRSSFASGDARTIRADGPGWSMVARTDDIAFLLLDEVPGEILPVGRGTELPGLLKALDGLAVRPS
ncbi:hypothetical protein [Streptomyces sp. RKAG290]|uniref:hypothetical protein n=1 Tax=Streptomyces sp. RKAG290 TaxID=2888348 RepID=UPI002033E590|nr:hypothetical protein [Streptomyces sp. RKAG290]MCM2416041.1 hypothetical protein [Streptomyces sp. RKAG290]